MRLDRQAYLEAVRTGRYHSLLSPLGRLQRGQLWELENAYKRAETQLPLAERQRIDGFRQVHERKLKRSMRPLKFT